MSYEDLFKPTKNSPLFLVCPMKYIHPEQHLIDFSFVK